MVTLKIDNVSANNLGKNHIIYGRSEHIEMRFYYLREQARVSEGGLKLEHYKCEDQVAGLLTKDVTIETFKKLKKLMSLETS